jgi:DNA-binding response OmpR family regulator
MKKVLVVEDDNVMRAIEIKELKKLGHEVLEASDGLIAVELAEKQQPNLILLDLMLPEKDGFGVLEDLRKSTTEKVSKVPVIVLSNLWSDKDILRTQALKVDGYFVKANTTMAEVMAKVTEVLG